MKAKNVNSIQNIQGVQSVQSIKNVKSVLVVKLSAIGDVIHALPVSYAIKETYPEARLTWVVEPPAYNLLQGNPYIDEIIVFEKKKFKSLGGFLSNYGPFCDKLRQHSYDAALDLQGLFKSAAIVWSSKAAVKLGTCNMREFSDRVSKPVVGPHARGHIVERYLDVARALGCRVDRVVFPVAVSDEDVSLARQHLYAAGRREEVPYVVLAVGANWPNKRWPARYFAKLADWLFDKGLLPVIAGGGPVDEQLAAEISGMMEIPPINMVGRTNLKQLAYIMREAKAVVGGDTGPVHLAAGMGTPVVMFMGPTDANRNGPYGQRENAVEVPRECKYCWKRACPKGLDCLELITPDMLIKKLSKYI